MSFFFWKYCTNLFYYTIWQRFTFFLSKVPVTQITIHYKYCLYSTRYHQTPISTSRAPLFRQTFANASDCVMQWNWLNFSIGKIEGFLQHTSPIIRTSFTQCWHMHHSISCSSAYTLFLCWELQNICSSSSLV